MRVRCFDTFRTRCWQERSPHRQQEATLTALIKREIEVLKTTRHENIVSYFGCLAFT